MKKDNKGFSLVELIIVIAIMAVLIGILAPQYLKYVNKSKVSTDITNAQEIQAAFSAAIADGQIGGNTTTTTDTAGTSTNLAALGIENLKTWPTSKVNKDYVWAVTWSSADGVTKITLNNKEVYPNATEYQTDNGVN